MYKILYDIQQGNFLGVNVIFYVGRNIDEKEMIFLWRNFDFVLLGVNSGLLYFKEWMKV